MATRYTHSPFHNDMTPDIKVIDSGSYKKHSRRSIGERHTNLDCVLISIESEMSYEETRKTGVM